MKEHICTRPAVPVKHHVRWPGQQIAKFALCLTTLAVLQIPIPAHAQSCTTFGQNIVKTFGTIPVGGKGVMQAALVSNRSDGRYVSYGEMPSISGNNGGSGPLVYHPATTVLGIPYPAYLQGTLAQFFSDRRFNPVGFFTDPFNPQNTDSLGIVVYLQGSGIFKINPGEVVLTLNSWGGGSYSWQGLCQDGMINGFYQNTEFVLSLFNQQVYPPIK